MSITTTNPICVESLKMLGDFWIMMIIDKLSDGPLRFRDLEHKVDGVNTATLASRLKNMTAAGLIERREQSRADVTYHLTPLGEKVLPVLDAVNEFSRAAKETSSDGQDV